MCILCKDEILEKLKTWVEIRNAGLELVNTTDDLEEKDHIIERLWELRMERED